MPKKKTTKKESKTATKGKDASYGSSKKAMGFAEKMKAAKKKK